MRVKSDHSNYSRVTKGRFETMRLALLVTALAPPLLSAPVDQWSLLRVHPHDAGAFTQGLAFSAEGELYESTGLYGESSLRRVDLESGTVLRKVDVERNYFAEGLAVLGGVLVRMHLDSS